MTVPRRPGRAATKGLSNEIKTMSEREGAPDQGTPHNVRNDDAGQTSSCAISADKATKKSSRLKRSSSPRSAKRKKRASTTSGVRELALYAGQVCLGVVRIGAKATAYDPDGRKIGVFRSEQAAIDALDKLALRP
jgi:hypothetical protein